MVFVFDIDGTICFDGMNIPIDIQKAIQLLSNDFEIVFASARSYRDCVTVLKHFKKHTVIGLNGAQVFRNGKNIDFKILDRTLYKQLVQYCNTHQIPYFIDDMMNYHTNDKARIPFYPYVDNLKLATAVLSHEIIYPQKLVINLQQHLSYLPHLETLLKNKHVSYSFHEHEQFLYVNPKDCDKATTLQQFYRVYTCFGNDKNDIPLFQNAQWAIQVGDYEQLKQYADVVITKEEVAHHILQMIQKYKKNG